MATYAQLQSEQWWAREVVTPELDWLGDELCRRTGQPRTAAGTKGNERHLKGSHRSQEWIKNSRYCTNRTYTVQSGLTVVQQRHIAGFDFTPGAWGTAENRRRMIEQSKRIIAAMRAGQLDEVREFYGTVDGRTVSGWNNIENRSASSDSSHLDHWHAGLDRRHCTNRALMERIVSIALGDTTTGEDDGMSAEQVVEGVEQPRPFQSAGIASWAKESGYGPKSLRALTEYAWRDLTAVRDALAAAEARDAAILAAVTGGGQAQVLAAVAEQGERTRAALLAQAEADAQRDAELAELVRQGQSGELAADEVVRLIGERLTAPAGPGSA